MGHRISTTIRPERVYEVGDAEYLDLRRQGLILLDEPPLSADEATAATPVPTPEGATDGGEEPEADSGEAA
jgi:hypothetical protein